MHIKFALKSNKIQYVKIYEDIYIYIKYCGRVDVIITVNVTITYNVHAILERSVADQDQIPTDFTVAGFPNPGSSDVTRRSHFTLGKHGVHRPSLPHSPPFSKRDPHLKQYPRENIPPKMTIQSWIYHIRT